MILVLLVALLGAIIYLGKKYLYNYWNRHGFPQYEPTFLVGNIMNVIIQKESIGEFCKNVYLAAKKEHKVLGIYMLTKPALLINDPVIVQNIMIKDFQYFHDRGIYVDEENDPLSGHIFSLPGQKWRKLRVKLTPTFTSGKLKSMFPTILESGKVLETYIKKFLQSGNDIVEIRELLACYNTDIIASIAFGIENDSVNDSTNIFREKGRKVFATTIKNSMRQTSSFITPKISAYFKIKSVDADVEEFFLSMIKQTVDYREKNNVNRKDFMQLLLQLKNDGYCTVDANDKENTDVGEIDKTKLTLNELAAQAFVFFVAGFETTSSTMSYCLYELAKNSYIQRAVQDEIDRHGDITYDSINEMKYLDCCVDETLRKYPPLPILNRECSKDYKIPDTNLTIPKGTPILIPAFGLQRDPEIYQDPLVFKPERFATKSSGSDAKGLYYMPFGDGPRVCIGEKSILKSNISFSLYLKLSYRIANGKNEHKTWSCYTAV